MIVRSGQTNFFYKKDEASRLPTTLCTFGYVANFKTTLKNIRDLSADLYKTDPIELADSLCKGSVDDEKRPILLNLIQFIDFIKHLDWIIKQELLKEPENRNRFFKGKIKIEDFNTLKDEINALFKKSCEFISDLFDLGDPSQDIFNDFDNPEQQSTLRIKYDLLRSLAKNSIQS